MPELVKPIETRYKGYRFRSRLEARWAVYMDAMKIKYEYELEGFNLGNSLYYLPDFWLTDYDIWAEVKPDKFSGEELNKCFKLGESGKSFLFLEGSPSTRPYTFFDAKLFEILSTGIKSILANGKLDRTVRDDPLLAEFGRLCPDIEKTEWYQNFTKYGTSPLKEMGDLVSFSFQRVFICRCNQTLFEKKQFPRYFDKEDATEKILNELLIGVNAAKSARFEFGEHGL